MHIKYLPLWLECLQLQSPSEPASLLHMLQKKQELRFALLAAQLDYLTYRPTYMMLTMRHNLQQDLHIWWWFIPSKYSLQLPNCSKLYKVDARTYNIATWGGNLICYYILQNHHIRSFSTFITTASLMPRKSSLTALDASHLHVHCERSCSGYLLPKVELPCYIRPDIFNANQTFKEWE